MALNPRLELRQEQRLALTPEVRVRLSVLRMTPAELAEEVARDRRAWIGDFAGCGTLLRCPGVVQSLA